MSDNWWAQDAKVPCPDGYSIEGYYTIDGLYKEATCMANSPDAEEYCESGVYNNEDLCNGNESCHWHTHDKVDNDKKDYEEEEGDDYLFKYAMKLAKKFDTDPENDTLEQPEMESLIRSVLAPEFEQGLFNDDSFDDKFWTSLAMVEAENIKEPVERLVEVIQNL